MKKTVVIPVLLLACLLIVSGLVLGSRLIAKKIFAEFQLYTTANESEEKKTSDFEESWNTYLAKGHRAPAWDEIVRSGMELYFRKEHFQARDKFEQAIEAGCQDGAVYFYLGYCYDQAGVVNKEEQFYKKSIELLEKQNPGHRVHSQAHNNLSVIYHNRKENEKALKEVEIALKLNPNNSQAKSNIWIYQSALRKVNNAQKTIDKYQRQIKQDPNDIDGYIDIAKGYLENNQYDEALKYLRKGLEINPDDGRIYLGLANVYHKMNSYKDAEDNGEKALKLLEGKGAGKDLFWTYFRLGESYLLDGFQSPREDNLNAIGRKPIIYLEKAIQVAKDINDEWLEQEGLKRLWNCYTAWSGGYNYEKAIEIEEKRLEICRKNGWNASKYYLAWIYDRGYPITNRKDWAEKALKIYEELHGPDAGSGDLFLAMGNYEKAYKFFQHYVSLEEQELSGQKTLEAKERQLGWDQVEKYGNLIRCCIELKKDAEAFEVAEKFNARILLDLIGGKEMEGKKKKNAEMEKERHLVLAKIDELKQNPVENDQSGSADNLKRMERDLAIETNHLKLLDEKLKVSHDEIKSVNTIGALNVQEVQSLIGDVTLIEYFLGGYGVGAISIVSKEYVKSVLVPNLDRRQLELKIKEFKEAVMKSATSDLTLEELKKYGVDGKVSQLSREFYKFLIEPIKDQLKTRELYIVPSGALNYLPFYALQDENGRFLIEDYTISYTPSASILGYCMKKRKSSREKILIFANPDLGDNILSLKYAEKEAEEIAKIYPDTVVVTGKMANEEVVKKLAGENDMLHFACHGELNPEEPMLSYLRLTPEGKEDGYLYTREIFDLDLNANLVVLSACNTGLGKITLGSTDLIGMTRAFLFAGTPSVVASLWNVDDESTANLMGEFYRNLKTMTKAEALRNAQLAMMKERPNPYYWSAFCLIGDYK